VIRKILKLCRVSLSTKISLFRQVVCAMCLFCKARTRRGTKRSCRWAESRNFAISSRSDYRGTLTRISQISRRERERSAQCRAVLSLYRKEKWIIRPLIVELSRNGSAVELTQPISKARDP
jgi:hypothetical protein